MFASVADAHTKAVLAAAADCIITDCEAPVAFVKVGITDLFGYCQEHGDRLRQGLAPVQDGEC
jgi:hypothetical protein